VVAAAIVIMIITLSAVRQAARIIHIYKGILIHAPANMIAIRIIDFIYKAM
jgi:hypothetical protein